MTDSVESMRTKLWDGLMGRRKVHPRLIDDFEQAIRDAERRMATQMADIQPQNDPNGPI